jgi:glutathione peroxidase
LLNHTEHSVGNHYREFKPDETIGGENPFPIAGSGWSASSCLIAPAGNITLSRDLDSGGSLMAAALYEVPVRRIDGSPASLGDHKGNVMLVVNVASQCGLTPQYAQLEEIYETYRDRGFVVLGFPANEFAGQEPGSNAEIQQFCQTKFGVKFPMFEKIVVKGQGQHPLYQHLTAARPTAQQNADGKLRKTLEQHGLAPTNATDIMWNFEKFLINRQGEVVGRFAPDVAPKDPALTSAIESELSKPT